MKKIIIVIVSIIIIIFSMFYYWYYNTLKEQKIIENYNSQYEFYTKDDVLGVDLITIINKAIDNNERYLIPKDNKKLYIEDDENSLKVYIKLVSDGDFFPMESFVETGLNKFVIAFGSAIFKCTSIKHHSNGKISRLDFEIIT